MAHRSAPEPTDGSVGRSLERVERALRECEAAHARTRAHFERFLHSVSHDLREPLRMVSSYCGLLQRRYAGTLADEANEFLAFAGDGARRMQSMLDALVDLSRVAIGPCAREPVSCDEALDAALDRLTQPLARTAARIERGPLPIVRGDAARIAQLFGILVSNALEHRGSEAPRIDVGSSREGARWRLTVSDRGPGIAPELRERVFEPFWSTRRASRGPQGATGDPDPRPERGPGAEPGAARGLGLALARAIVERHGGRIEVEPRPGGGSIFVFTLSAEDEDVE